MGGRCIVVLDPHTTKSIVVRDLEQACSVHICAHVQSAPLGDQPSVVFSCPNSPTHDVHGTAIGLPTAYIDPQSTTLAVSRQSYGSPMNVVFGSDSGQVAVDLSPPNCRCCGDHPGDQTPGELGGGHEWPGGMTPTVSVLPNPPGRRSGAVEDPVYPVYPDATLDPNPLERSGVSNLCGRSRSHEPRARSGDETRDATRSGSPSKRRKKQGRSTTASISFEFSMVTKWSPQKGHGRVLSQTHRG